jgi:DNA polymerase I-like protein with 3'-5' exonuclease and polymerase domains
MKVEGEKALNYLIQSTASDMFLRQAIKIDKLLEGTRSEIAFCVHDSLILDVSREDKSLLEKIINIFKETDLGEFRVNASIGKNFGNMRKIL